MNDKIDPRKVENLDLNGNPIPARKKNKKKGGAGKGAYGKKNSAKGTAGKKNAAKGGDAVKLGSIMQKKPVRRIEHYYYFSDRPLDARKLQAAVPESYAEAADIWPELNLMEVVMDYDSLIFQDAQECFIDPEDQKFFAQKGICAWYDISFGSADIAKVREVMNGVLTQCGGFVGSDTDDFEPSYTADNIDTLV